MTVARTSCDNQGSKDKLASSPTQSFYGTFECQYKFIGFGSVFTW